MTNRSDRGSNKPRGAERFERVDLIRDSICGLHQGQQPCGAARTGEHMDAPDRCSSLHKTSCTTGAVHIWLDGHIIAQLRACRGRRQHQVNAAASIILRIMVIPPAGESAGLKLCLRGASVEHQYGSMARYAPPRGVHQSKQRRPQADRLHHRQLASAQRSTQLLPTAMAHRPKQMYPSPFAARRNERHILFPSHRLLFALLPVRQTAPRSAMAFLALLPSQRVTFHQR